MEPDKNLNDIVGDDEKHKKSFLRDILNFRTVLGVAGFLTPAVIAYSLTDFNIHSYRDFLDSAPKIFAMTIDSMALGFFGAIAGYEIGEKIDEKLFKYKNPTQS